MTLPQSDTEALVLALQLALNAPTDEEAQQAAELADRLAAKLTTDQIEACKAIAQQSMEAS